MNSFMVYENCESFHIKYIEYKIACIEHDITKAQVFTQYISDCVNAKLFSSKTFHIYNSPTLYLLATTLKSCKLCNIKKPIIEIRKCFYIFY